MNNQYQVPVTYESRGYITVTADNFEDAKSKIRSLPVRMDYDACEANVEMMPELPDLTITGVIVLIELDES